MKDLLKLFKQQGTVEEFDEIATAAGHSPLTSEARKSASNVSSGYYRSEDSQKAGTRDCMELRACARRRSMEGLAIRARGG